MDDYLFHNNPAEQEILRLRKIETAMDPWTIRHLSNIGIQTGWQCLELGTGGGSILQWLGNTVGRSGKVIGIDKNTGHVQHLNTAPYQIIEGDFLDLSLDQQLDFMHCRYVLIHNQQDLQMLEKIYATLKTGGKILLEEPDFTAAQRLNDDAERSQANVNEACCQMFQNMDLDPAYGLHLPKKLSEFGFEIIAVESALHLHPGQSSFAVMMGESVQHLQDQFIATSHASAEDIQHYVANSQNSNYWTVYGSTVSIIAQKS